MEITALCIIASLRVSPSSSQFFTYDSVTLSCGERENSSAWRVKRNTSRNTNEECSTTWGNRNESNCFIDDLYAGDTGVYWCESEGGQCSNAINITVTAGSVILKSPVLPVPEGEAVTLRCTSRPSSSNSSSSSSSSSNLTAEFYKDGRLITSSSTGSMTIHGVSKSDEGFYRCGISGSGESPDSWLAVRAAPPESLHSPLAHVVFPVVGVCLLLVSVSVLYIWRRRKGGISSGVSYTDVTITQERKRERETETTTTLYTTINP